MMAGCQVDSTLNVEEEDSQTVQQEDSSQDDTQETASEPGSEESLTEEPADEETLVGESPEEESSTDDGSSTDTGDSTPVVETAATLMWDAPAERENGDTLKVGEIDYYIVSWGQDPDTLANTEEVPCVNCTDMEHVIEDLDEGTWYFTVQTRDTDGNVSRPADLATKQI